MSFKTLSDTLAENADLDQLCADRPLNSNEIFSGNAYYGIGRILKAYAGLHSDYRLKAVIPHGVYLDENLLWDAEERVSLPAVLFYPAYRATVYKQRTRKYPLPAASPFVYLVKMLQSQSQSPGPRSGTLFFPQHSTHHVMANMDYGELADVLVGLGDEFRPVNVCIYWKDYLLGRHQPFLDRHLRVVSAGHIYDPYFLDRLFHLLNMHEYAAGNGLGSHVFYAVYAGCRYFHLDGIPSTSTAPPSIAARDIARIAPDRERKLREIFSERTAHALSVQRESAYYYLGARYMKSPQELRRQLMLCEVADKLGFMPFQDSGKRRAYVPPYLRRVARSIWRAPLRIVRSKGS